MRVARWCWVLALVVVVVGGCMPRQTAVLPSSLSERLRGMHLRFTPATPAAGSLSPADVITGLKASYHGMSPFRRSRAIPVFGIITCDREVGQCDTSLSPSGTVWFVLFPDAVNGGGDFSWAWVDGIAGTGGTSIIHDPHVP